MPGRRDHGSGLCALGERVHRSLEPIIAAAMLRVVELVGRLLAGKAPGAAYLSATLANEIKAMRTESPIANNAPANWFLRTLFPQIRHAAGWLMQTLRCQSSGDGLKGMTTRRR